MPSRPSRPRRGHGARPVVVAVLAGLVTALLPAAAAHAEERTVRGGRLDWGLKSSFQSYVTGPVAHGSWNLTGGAATVGGSQFRFHSAKGSYDPASGAFSAAFSGGVHFTGHKKGSSYQLDLAIGRPTVKVSGGSGTLYADVVSKAKGSGKVTSATQVPFASLNLSGIDMKGGSGPIALTHIPATLTAQGAKAFAGYYTAGTRLDPLSLSADLTAATGGKSARKPDKSPEKSAKKSGEKAGEKSGEKAKAAGRIEDAAVDWGVRRTFREYVSGSIARGKWSLTAGAQDGGALFRFPRGEGSYDKKKRTLAADFTGAVRFTGKHGLDIGLSRVAVGVQDGKGTLYADVDSGDFTKKKAPLVTFTGAGLADLKPKDGLIAVTEAPAKLTADGARAFGSLYKAGTAMDPVSLAVAVDEKAELPALPDLGSAAEPKAAKAPDTGPKKEKAAASADDTSDSSAALPITIGAVAALLVAAAAAFGIVRKRRGARAAGTADDSTGTP
ncbi:HtaA domain-containing protein [Streptomyces sp. MNP-20]|uniref:HtaA domain-containing protein n=1 Tax=Streptomyces sp. MNP-20 TaxID=2721165 RepID=UPI001C1E83D6|nr:HtaA domain-containing protein [Streptomyces sp. MNP-20]